MTQTPQPPAGWYPQGDVERWWDGTAWSAHTRPLPTAQPQAAAPPTHQLPGQPAYAQPQAGQPQYGQPQAGYGAPQTHYMPPQQKSHTARNVLIVIGVLFLLLVGGCVAVGLVVSNEVDKAINDDTLGGPNNPMTIEPGQGFEVNGFEYGDGWTVGPDASGLVDIQNLKVTNNRGEPDRAIVQIKLLLDDEVLATSNCSNAGDSIPDGITVTLDCYSGDAMPAEYDRVTINDLF